jgi:hypothetical protein
MTRMLERAPLRDRFLTPLSARARELTRGQNMTNTERIVIYSLMLALCIMLVALTLASCQMPLR